MAVQFEFKRMERGKFYFFVFNEGRLILSSEPYTQMRSAKRGYKSFLSYAHQSLAYIRLDTPEGHSFCLQSKNGKIIGYGQYYENPKNRDADIVHLMDTFAPTPICPASYLKSISFRL